MNTPGLRPGYRPPELGQDKEEPELNAEEDIPTEDGGERPADEPLDADPGERKQP